MKKFFEKIPAWGVMIFFCGTFLLMNFFTPHLTDDYAYSFVWDEEHGGNFQNNVGDLKRVENISDVFHSQYEHYMTWGGRTIAHSLLQFCLMYDKIFFDFANAICYGVLALLIYFIGTGKFEFKNFDAKILTGIFFALWFCLPDFFQTTLWETGSFNYLWMSVFQFAFLLPFAAKFWRKKFFDDFSKVKIIFAAIFGLFAGWSNESGGASIILVTFFALIYFLRQKKFERWSAVGFLFLLVGFALQIFAPGNFARMEEDYGSEEDAVSLSEMLLGNFTEGFLPVFIGSAILLAVIALYFLSEKKSVETSRFIFLFTATGILMPCLLMLSPYFPARAAFVTPIFFTAAAVAAVQKISLDVPKKIFCAVGIFWAATIIYSLAVDFSVHLQIAERHEYISQHKNADMIIVSPVHLPPSTEMLFWNWTLDEKARFYNDLTPYERINRNKTYAKYFGVKRLVADELQWSQMKQFPLYDD